jgi:beta-fructofuranosidase
VTARGARDDVATSDSSRHPDPSFPRLHGRPGRGWLNDPHGCIAVDGRYHVFFQHNPDRATHGEIKWGHMSSTDLAHWREEPIALVNRPGELDEFGCWTGCAIDDRGVPTVIYSAVADTSEQSVVLLARSDRHLHSWQQDRRPACGLPRDPAVSHARDPFVFELEGRRYAIQGAGHYQRPGVARVLVYDCDDLSAWRELGPLVSATEDPIAAEVAPAHVWECPNLVRFGERWVLIVSLWSRTSRTIRAEEVRYLVGDLRLTADGPRFHAASGGLLDTGPCFYAPQVLRQDDRTLIWGWARERGRPQTAIDAAGWAGTLTFCRELRLVDDELVSQPVEELDTLRRRPLDIVPDVPFSATAFDIELSNGGGAASLWLLDDAGEHPVAGLDLAPTAATGARILVDGSIIEVFAAGDIPFTTRAYPSAHSAWRLRVERDIDVSGWTLGS